MSSTQPWDETTRKSIENLAKHVLEALSNEKDESNRPWLLQELLTYFVQSGGNQQALSAKAIAAELFKSTNEAKVYISRLRKELEKYFLSTTSGRTLTHRLEIPNKSKGGSYELSLVPNTRNLAADLRFWDIYTASDSYPLIIYTHPLFFWDKANRLYLRFLDINHDNLQGLNDKLTRIVKKFGLEDLEPCFHYVSIGESKMIRHLQHWFRKHWSQGAQLPLKNRNREEHKSPLEVTNSREVTGDKAYNSNIIVLGNARTNEYIESFQRKLRYRLGAELVTGQGRTPAEDLQYCDGKEGDGAAYVVVTRLPNRNSGKQVTLIAANNGIAGAKVVEELTSKTFLENKVFNYMGWNTARALPHHFQIVFEVYTDRTDAYNVEPVGKDGPSQ